MAIYWIGINLLNIKWTFFTVWLVPLECEQDQPFSLFFFFCDTVVVAIFYFLCSYFINTQKKINILPRMRTECSVSQLDTRQTTHKRYSWRSIVLGSQTNRVFYALFSSSIHSPERRYPLDVFVCICITLKGSLSCIQMRISLHVITIAHLVNNFPKTEYLNSNYICIK